MSEEKRKLEDVAESDDTKRFKQERGVAQIKPEFIIDFKNTESIDDDSAEQNSREVPQEDPQANGKKNKNKKKGQNKARNLVQAKETFKLCPSVLDTEKPCVKGVECRFSHSVEDYLAQKPTDLEGSCPVWDALGYCPLSIKCRWLHSHFNTETKSVTYKETYDKQDQKGEINWISNDDKRAMSKKAAPLRISDLCIQLYDNRKEIEPEERKRMEAEFHDSIVKPGEKKKLDHRGKMILSPLATVGNLPFRRMMRGLGADVTYSEMTLTMPLISGQNSEWALLKAHKSEYPGFGAQIATNKSWQAAKAVESIARYAPQMSEINLNCGCPIDLLFKKGEGSGLMANPKRMKAILKNMAYTSGDIPITVKMRMGVQDSKPNAVEIVKSLLDESGGDIAAVTIHGRSRQQRYSRAANWEYIQSVGQVVKEYNESFEEEKEVSDRPNPVYLIGNGDIFTHEDWNHHMALEGVDSVMVARGALIKPWIFEEFKAQQYLDKTASERLELLRTYTNYALEHWGTDEFGINTVRRFLCEYLSFTHRYIPVGILDKLPPRLNERPPKWRGRNELETLLGSSDCNDWIKITEMFLGKASDSFAFIPKHKSNS